MEVGERRELLVVSWEWKGVPLEVAFDRVGASGRMVRLSCGGGRDSPRVVFDGQPRYRAEVEGKVVTSRLQDVRWEVEADELRAELTLGTFVLGPISGKLVYTFYEGLPLFVEELRVDLPVRSVERSWFGFRTGPGRNVFKEVHWEGGRCSLSELEGKLVSDSPFLYLWDGRLGLGMLCPRPGGRFRIEAREDWTACAGLALEEARSFPVVYYLGTWPPEEFEGMVEDLKVREYRRLTGHRVLVVPREGSPLRSGADVAWGGEVEGAVHLGRDVRCPGRRGHIGGKGLYIVPEGEVEGQGCLDEVAARVHEAGGVLARLCNCDLPPRKVRDLWSPDIKLFGLSGIEEELRRYESLLERGLRVYMLGVGGLVNYVEASDVPGLVGSLREGRHFLTTGEVLATTYRLFDGELWLGLDWTFPLEEVEVVSEGKVLYREEPPPEVKGKKGFTFPVEGRRWVRVEVRDVTGGVCLLQPLFHEEVG